MQNGVIRKEKKQILHLECGVHNAFNTLLSEILLAKAIYFSEDTTFFSVIACQTTAKLVNYMLFNDKEKRCGWFTCQKKLNLSIVGKGGKRGEIKIEKVKRPKTHMHTYTHKSDFSLCCKIKERKEEVANLEKICISAM